MGADFLPKNRKTIEQVLGDPNCPEDFALFQEFKAKINTLPKRKLMPSVKKRLAKNKRTLNRKTINTHKKRFRK